MIYADYSSTCYDSGCKAELIAHGEYSGIVLCRSCSNDFKIALKNGFPGEYNEETYDRYVEIYGNKKERIERFLDKVWNDEDKDEDKRS